MARNGSGTYSLPAGNPVVASTLITITWANTTMTDVGTEITNSLDRNGRGGMLAALKGTDGTAAAPAFSFTSEPASGLYRLSAAILGMSVGAANVQTWWATRTGFGRTADSTNAKVQVESSTDSNLLEMQNTTAQAFGGMLLKSNDRTWSFGIRSSSHASGELAYLSTSVNTAPIALQVGGVDAFRALAGASPNCRVYFGLQFTSSASGYLIQSNGTNFDIWGGSATWRVLTNNGASANLSCTDAGVLTVRTGVDSPYFNATSARRFKANIRSVDPLKIVRKARLRQYDMNGLRRVGLVADEAPKAVRSGLEHIDVYGLAAVAAAGVGAVLERLERLESHVGLQG